MPRLVWEAASLSSSRTLIVQSRPLSWTLFISLTAMTRLGFRGDCTFFNLTLGFHYAGILTTEMASIFMVECRETFWFCEQFQLHLTTTTLTTICSIQMGLYKPTFPLAVTFKPFFGHLTRAPMRRPLTLPASTSDRTTSSTKILRWHPVMLCSFRQLKMASSTSIGLELPRDLHAQQKISRRSIKVFHRK